MGASVQVGPRNLVSQARKTLHVFGAMMRHEWWGLPITVEAFRQALARGVKLHLMVGPYFDIASFEFIRMLAQHPRQVSLYLVGQAHGLLVYDAGTGRQMLSTTIVSDRQHVFLANQPEARGCTHDAGGKEYMNAVEVAEPLMATFFKLLVHLGDAGVPPQDFFTAARACGLGLERWAEGGLSGLESHGQWVGVPDDELVAYERQLVQVAA